MNSGIMYSSDHGLLLGFHGCDQSVRDGIITGKMKMRASTNKYDWLGSGMYFWQNNHDRAIEFAENSPGKNKHENPAVFGAVFCLSNCLDLTDKKYIKEVREAFVGLKKKSTVSNIPMPKNKSVPGTSNSNEKVLRDLDCAVIEFLHWSRFQKRKAPYDSVRCVFVEGEPIYEDSAFYEKTHIQVCIRNQNCIKGFFLPRMSEN
jgi:hypothetical protein